jgi:hypothetical protein
MALPVWGRLEKDGARGVAILKHHISSPSYPIMMRGKLGSGIKLSVADFALPLGCADTLIKIGALTDEYLVIAFDFSPDNPNMFFPLPQAPATDTCAPCPSFFPHRGTPAPPPRSTQDDLALRMALAASTREARVSEMLGYNGN